MTMRRLLLGGLLAIAVPHNARAQIDTDPPIACTSCERWNEPLPPFRIHGNTYYVGTASLSSILIASDDGLILLDAALPQSVPLIDANIRALGFRTEDIALIVNSHTHFDHAGGIAALQRASGAVVAASPSSAQALRQGGPVASDPQFAYTPAVNGFPAVRDVEEIEDGESLTVGELQITAVFTPGHAPGGTTWTWRSCEDQTCLDIVYVDSLNAVSAPGFRYTGDADTPSIVNLLRQSIRRVEDLSCDIFLAPHPGFFEIQNKLDEGQRDPSRNPFIDRGACRGYAAAAAELLEERIAAEL